MLIRLPTHGLYQTIGHSSALNNRLIPFSLSNMVAANLTQLFGTLITASHILHFHGVLDAYGHLSVRNPNNASTFFMSRNEAPALMASASDIVEYYISDASPVEPNAPRGFIERYIHSEIFKRFSAINSVVHSHSPPVIPFSISGVPMKPSIHLAGFLGIWPVVLSVPETQD